MEELKILKERRSIRSFSSRAVSKEIIEEIINCGRLAPTARNEQPWKFVVITDQEKRRKIAQATDYGKFIADAPVCIAVFCIDTKYYLEDGSAATTYIMLAAKAFGLGSCWIAGDKKSYANEIRKTLGMPDNYKLISLIPIGYPNNENHTTRAAKKQLNEVIVWANN